MCAVTSECAVASTTGSASAGGAFDRAIEVVLPRTVKLYGLKVGRQAGYGTGVVVSKDGLVLTVFSLLIDARQLRAVTSDGTRYGADVVHRDPQRQLALIRLKPLDEEGRQPTAISFPHFDIPCNSSGSGSSNPQDPGSCDRLLRPGDWVLTAGNPFKVAEGAEPVSIAHGVFSARTRLDARRGVREFRYQGDVLVIDAITSNPGAPGSAVVNLDGEFVGMIGRVVTSNLTHTHFNYAIPRDVLSDYLLEATQSEPATVAEAVPTTEGGGNTMLGAGIRVTRTGYRRIPPFVERVRRGSPALHAGVRKDDLILSVNGRSVADVEAYDDRMGKAAPNEPIDLVIRRGRRILTIRIEPTRSKPQGMEP